FIIARQAASKTVLVAHLVSSVLQHMVMDTDDLDITATRYTGTDLAGALGMDPVTDPDKAMNIVQREFQQRFDQTWAKSYGFENSYAVAVTKEFAKEKGIETISD